MLYAVVFFMAILVLVSALFGSVTIGDQIKVIKDSGLFSLSFFAVTYAVISGAGLLHKELSRRTIYNILSRPVSRAAFVSGKYLGMLATVFVLLILMTMGLSVFTAIFEGSFDSSLFTAAFFIFLQLAIICAFALFFSSIVITPLLSGLFTFGVFLAGRSSDYILFLIEHNQIEGNARTALKALYTILPHLNWLDVSNQVVYGISIPANQICGSAFYALSYVAVLFMLTVLFFSKKEFNQQ